MLLEDPVQFHSHDKSYAEHTSSSTVNWRWHCQPVRFSYNDAQRHWHGQIFSVEAVMWLCKRCGAECQTEIVEDPKPAMHTLNETVQDCQSAL